MEGGGVGLNYTNGIGSAQRFPEAIEVAASSSANRSAKLQAGSVPVRDSSGSGIQADQANLSASASTVAQALSGSDVRADKVLGLQQSIAAGTYNIPSSVVAAKVLSAMMN